MNLKAWIAMVGFVAVLAGGAARAQTVEYVHTDALGSIVVVTNSARQAIEPRSVYRPYGLTASASVDKPGFAGHVSDALTGLSYMQQRYYDPELGLFLSVDPVGAYQQPIVAFNRYRYANDNPYGFIDPDGRLSRGTGFTDDQWKKFNQAQQRAAKRLEKAASKINRVLATGKGVKGLTRSFERNFGAGSGTTENMTKVASDLTAMAGALSNTGEDAISANGMTTDQIDKAYGGSNSTTLAAVPSTKPVQVIVNTTHADFGISSILSWATGHEMGHAVLGYHDDPFNGQKGYKFGTPAQRDSFKNFPSPQRLTNPDHLMDYVQ